MKKKIVFALILVAAVLLLASCVSTGKQPKWVTKVPQVAYKHYVVGYGRERNFQQSRNESYADAQNLLSQWLSVSVSSATTSSYSSSEHQSSNPRANSYTADENFQDQLKRFTESVLAGASIEEYWTDPEGGVYTLVSVPFDDAYEQFGAFTAIPAPTV